MKNHLQAYRFSEQEMNKMIELKGIFEQNELLIDRFPEVYYDTYDNYIEGYLEIEDDKENVKENDVDNIDYLGVYTDFWIPLDEINSKEGIIVLFKDRIEKYCYVKQIEVNSVRFIVLMHELGHWLTHWATFNNENWSKGYKAGTDKKTHESLAQLIAYWAVDGNPKLEDILERLTPKDRTDPYALYKNLTGLSKSSILTKLIEIRKHYFLPDLILYSFLEHSKTDKMLNFFGEYLFSKEINEEIISKCTKSKNTDSALTFFEDLKKKIEDVMKDKEHTTNTNDKLKELIQKILPTDQLIEQFKEIIHDLRGPNASKRFGL
jgi:hypothetical protein